MCGGVYRVPPSAVASTGCVSSVAAPLVPPPPPACRLGCCALLGTFSPSPLPPPCGGFCLFLLMYCFCGVPRECLPVAAVAPASSAGAPAALVVLPPALYTRHGCSTLLGAFSSSAPTPPSRYFSLAGARSVSAAASLGASLRLEVVAVAPTAKAAATAVVLLPPSALEKLLLPFRCLFRLLPRPTPWLSCLLFCARPPHRRRRWQPWRARPPQRRWLQRSCCPPYQHSTKLLRPSGCLLSLPPGPTLCSFF